MNDIDQEESTDPANQPDDVAKSSDGSDDQQQPVERQAVRRKPSPTPFDHPLSFPILVGALGLWFGYDWLFNPKIQSKAFNMWMFWICMVVFALTIRIGLREMRIVRERKRKKAEEEELLKAEG